MFKFRLWPVLATTIMGTSLCLIGYQSAFAQGMSGGAGPIGELQAQIDALAPNSSVEGRTYCSVLTQTILRSDPNVDLPGPPPDRDGLAIRVIRRTFTFLDGGTNIEGVLDSRAHNNLLTTPGRISLVDPGMSPALIEGTYVQTGQKLDLNIATFGYNTTWYVSKDGSVIHGTRIDQAVITNPNNMISVLTTRDWTLVENDTCETEVI